MRRILLTLIVITFSASLTFAADFTLNWGVNVEPIIYFKKASAEFKKNVEKRSNGRIQVQLFENAIPEEGHEHLADVQSGLYHMGQATTFQLEKYIPELALWNLPYLFKDDEHVSRYIHSPVAQLMLEKLGKQNVIALGHTYSGGFVQVYGDKIDSISELNGKVLALEESGKDFPAFLQSQLKIQISPAGVNHDQFLDPKSKTKGSEIITSTVDEIFDVAKKRPLFLNMSEHRVISRVLYISKPFVESLPADLREIVLDEGRKAALYERDLSIQDKKKILSMVTKNKVTFNRWSAKKKRLEKSKFDGLYKAYTQKHGDEVLKFIEGIEIPRRVGSLGR